MTCGCAQRFARLLMVGLHPMATAGPLDDTLAHGAQNMANRSGGRGLHFGRVNPRVHFDGGAYPVEDRGWQIECKTFPPPGGQQKTKQTDMNTLEIKGDWNITKGKLKQKWAKLTDNDLRYAEGQQEELVGRIQKLTGETREVVENTIKEYSSACGCK